MTITEWIKDHDYENTCCEKTIAMATDLAVQLNLDEIVDDEEMPEMFSLESGEFCFEWGGDVGQITGTS